MTDSFSGAFANWSCAIAGTIDFGDDMPAKVRWCVMEVVKEISEIGSAKWFVNGHSRDRLEVSEEVSCKLIEILQKDAEPETQEQFDALVWAVRVCLTDNTASLEEAARSVIYDKGGST